ncbi:salivaricin M family lantibiotic [Pseudobacteroides cellulosolvens]|uniref:Plantaricin C family lantibiotic n=1 Tax=Pseudobacteroides cellulosolvens ATCC 35603 = DSM 2933 TaxID=398512 RepID=A0A0L6JSX7_9FIRM|nr:salivaricin M family lantibiotic [Pseudobacteroides cellulosolvens]KNY28951.1 hypothetical protein Bccel_4225 [Pseudobacteroides cellulosolvens ATCC 35603 = DSM 2933]
MSKEKMRNQLTEEKVTGPISGVVEEIKGQDLDEKAGAGLTSAIQMTLAGKCGRMLTVSYECSSPHVSCG